VLDNAFQIINVINVEEPRMATYTVGVLNNISNGVPKLQNPIESTA
jgi:hypothetical protein